MLFVTSYIHVVKNAPSEPKLDIIEHVSFFPYCLHTRLTYM